MKRILIVEDEKDLAELIAFNLEKEGYRPIIALDGISGMEAAHKDSPDLVLLDLMLPGIQGTDICKILKRDERTAGIPIIMLTAKGEEIDRVVGLEVGADDYITKPFSTRELMLRVKAVLRRTRPEAAAAKIIKVGPISINTECYSVSVNDQEVVLTTTEFKLLQHLAERLTHITRLRTKLGEAGELIKTTRGFGYKMEKE